MDIFRIQSDIQDAPFLNEIIDLYFLIAAVTARLFIPTAELVTPTGTQTNEAEIETNSSC